MSHSTSDSQLPTVPQDPVSVSQPLLGSMNPSQGENRERLSVCTAGNNVLASSSGLISSAVSTSDNTATSAGSETNSTGNGIKPKRPATNTGRKARAGQHLWNLWSWELLAAIFSILCIAAVIGVLAAMDGRFLDQWALPISPNALVSVFVTLSKAALLLIVAEGISQMKWMYFQDARRRLYDLQIFDEASRGPWGACVLLFSIRNKALIASIGAVITIVSMAMDPFAQQVIQYDTVQRNRTQGEPAWVSKATRWTNGLVPWGLIGGAESTDSRQRITSAMLTGLSELTPQTMFSCATGNCTWPIFETLATCSECNNITETAPAVCENADAVNQTQMCTVTSVTYPNMSVIMTRRPGGKSGPIATRMNMTTLTSPCPPGCDMGAFPPVLAAIARRGGVSDDDIGQREWPMEIYECSFRFCSKQYNTSVVNGTLQQTLLRSQPLVFPSDLCEADPGTGQAVPTSGFTIPFTQDEVCPGYPENAVPANSSSNAQAAVDDLNSYAIGMSGTIWSQWQWQDMMTHAVSLRSSAGFSPNFQNGTQLAALIYYAHEGNFIKTMESIANSVTHQIRHNQNFSLEIGSTLELATVVKVQWIWATLPLALVLLGIAFFCAAVAVSAQASKHVWKSSILGPVFHRVEGSDADELDQRTLKQMEYTARRIDVVLANDLDGRPSLCRSYDVVSST